MPNNSQKKEETQQILHQHCRWCSKDLSS